MSAAPAPLPPRDRSTQVTRDAGMRADRRSIAVLTVVILLVGLSGLVSFNWSAGGFIPEAPTGIFLAALVGAIIYVSFRYAAANARTCPACSRRIPPDALLCPYCGQRLS